MKMNVEFESREELLSFVGMFGATLAVQAPTTAKVVEDKKEDAKPVVEKSKKEKAETKKAEQPKTDKAKAEEKKQEVPKVEAEITGVDETPTDQAHDAEVTEDKIEVTKEMLRALCSQAIKAGKSAEVKNIVSKYGASKLPDLKEESYADAYKDVEALL